MQAGRPTVGQKKKKKSTCYAAGRWVYKYGNTAGYLQNLRTIGNTECTLLGGGVYYANT